MVAVAPQAESPRDATTKPAIQDAFTTTSRARDPARASGVTLPPGTLLSPSRPRVCKRTTDESAALRVERCGFVRNEATQLRANPSEATGMLKMVSIGVNVPVLPIAKASIVPAPPLST